MGCGTCPYFYLYTYANMYVNIMCIASYSVLMFMLILKIRLLMFPSRTKRLCVKLDDRAYGLSDEIKKK